VNFTREPIIETIISPREGYRLIVRSTKHASDEEFTVDAVEIVSFGSALFYRSLEKPHPFLLPVADYQVVEGKESRVVLKNAKFERTIKIGGGREASLKKEEELEETPPLGFEDESSDEPVSLEPYTDRKRERRRTRRRRGGPDSPRPEHTPSDSRQDSSPPKEVVPSAPLFLIPPPTSLIADSIQKYKDQQAQAPHLTEPPKEASSSEDSGEANTISRTLLEPPLFIPGSPTAGDWGNFLS
jgi:hypothetical protein